MNSIPPTWQAHTSSGYSTKMDERCGHLLAEIISNKPRRHAIISDPRSLHAELFSDFTPPGYSEYAGTYRGAVNTTLADRQISAPSQLHPGTQYEYAAPRNVEGMMDKLFTQTRDFHAEATDDYQRLLALAYHFCWFGKIHPFLDGNGHVQRTLFAAYATDVGFTLSNRFAIHPRPYDRLLGTALEIFTRAEGNSWQGELPLVGEYLAFFLGGAFDAPRKNLATASPED